MQSQTAGPGVFLMDTYIIPHLDSLHFLTLSSSAVGKKGPFSLLSSYQTLSDVPTSIHEPAVCFTGRALWMQAHEKEKSKVLGGIFHEVDMGIMRGICAAAWKKKAFKLFLFCFLSSLFSEPLCYLSRDTAGSCCLLCQSNEKE